MRWREQIIAILVCMAILCSGCMGSREIDELSFILTIGVDQSDEPGMYVFSFRVAMPRSFAGDSGGDNKDKTKLVSVKAPAIGTAVRQLAIAMNRQPELSHVSALFVHEDVAKAGIHELVTLFLRSKVYRNTMVLLVTKEEVKTVMEKNTSPFELFQYRWVDSVKQTQKFAANYMLNDIRSFYINLADAQHSIMTGYGSVIDKSLTKTALAPLPHQLVPQYNVDDFPREGGTELIVVGSAVFYDWKMVGTLNSAETLGANILEKGIQTMITIPDPLAAGEKVSLALETIPPKTNIRFNKQKMVMDVTVDVICELADTSSKVDYTKAKNRQKLEEAINESVKANLSAYFQKTQALGTDCVQITDQYRYKVGTWNEWAAIDWPSVYRQAEISITANTSLRRSGLLWRYAKEDNV